MIYVSKIPVAVDIHALLQRLFAQEAELLGRLATIENQIRKFEDFERPAYEGWLRLELGPELVNLQEIVERIHVRQILAQKINTLVETRKLTPREALYVATFHSEQSYESHGQSQREDEIDARRKAKREVKRAARRAHRKERKQEERLSRNSASEKHEKNQKNKKNEKNEKNENNRGVSEGTSRLVSLYRGLVRKLHPDSPVSLQGFPASRMASLWMEVQAAYHSSNVERLLAIAAWLGQGTGNDGVLETSSSVLTFSERFDRIRMLIRSCARLEGKLTQLRSLPAWEFERVRGQARRKLRQRALRELDAETRRTQEALEMLDDFIESIGAPKRPKNRS